MSLNERWFLETNESKTKGVRDGQLGSELV